MNETKKTDLKAYEAPETKRTQVELEDSLCSASQPIKEKQTAQVEVDKWVSVENDVTFE